MVRKIDTCELDDFDKGHRSRPAAGSEEEEHGLLVELTAKARRVLRCCKRGARTDEDLAALMAWAKTTSALSQMPEEEMAKICQDMYLRPLQLGEPLFYQSQRPDAFCVLMSGVIGFYCLPESEALDKIDEVKRVGIDTVVSYKLFRNHFFGQRVKDSSQPGDGFGELSIITGKTRAVGAIAEAETLVVKVGIQAYNESLSAMHGNWNVLAEKMACLQKMESFAHWKLPELTRLAYAMEEVSYRRGRCIFARGQPATEMMIIKTGECVLVKDQVLVATLRDGDLVGDDIILAGKKCYTLSVMASSNVDLFKISFHDLNKLMPGATGRQTTSILRSTSLMRRKWRRQYIKRAQQERARVMELTQTTQAGFGAPKVQFFMKSLEITPESLAASAAQSYTSAHAGTPLGQPLPQIRAASSLPETTRGTASAARQERPQTSPALLERGGRSPQPQSASSPSAIDDAKARPSVGHHSFAVAAAGRNPAIARRYGRYVPSAEEAAAMKPFGDARYSKV